MTLLAGVGGIDDRRSELKKSPKAGCESGTPPVAEGNGEEDGGAETTGAGWPKGLSPGKAPLGKLNCAAENISEPEGWEGG